MSCAALSAIVPGDPRREPFDLDGPCALQREAGVARVREKDTLTWNHARLEPTNGQKTREGKARRCRRTARALPGMMRALGPHRVAVGPRYDRRCRGGGQTRDAFVRTPGPRRPPRRQPRHFQTEKPKAKCRVVQHRARAETRRVAGRRDARRRRIAASSPTRRPGDARRTEGSDTVARASPRSPPRAHRAKPRRFFAS